MQTAQLNIKLEKALYEEIELIAKALHLPKNEWARKVLAYEAKKELEEQKLNIAREFMKGNITKKELIAVLGKKDAEDLDLILRIGKEGFERVGEIAQALKRPKPTK